MKLPLNPVIEKKLGKQDKKFQIKKEEDKLLINK
jgi:hypothetical protein